MIFLLPSGRQITLAHEIGSGAEGVIYSLVETKDLCVKIYLDDHLQRANENRLNALIELEPRDWEGDHDEHLHVSWPQAVVRDHSGQTRGFIMPRVAGERVDTLFDQYWRQKVFDEPSWRRMVSVATRIARLFEKLHVAGIVVGDVSGANVFVTRTGHVSLIDCDSVQFVDPETRVVYRAGKVTPEYSAPESLISNEPLTVEHDRFGLAILVCQLLMEGDHPFEGIPVGSTNDYGMIDQNIRLQNNRIVYPERFIPIQNSMPGAILPPAVRALVYQCFVEGHDHPERRPTAGEWVDVLDRAGFQLSGCNVNPLHNYPRTLTECIWCSRERAGFGDSYPSATGELGGKTPFGPEPTVSLRKDGGTEPSHLQWPPVGQQPPPQAGQYVPPPPPRHRQMPTGPPTAEHRNHVPTQPQPAVRKATQRSKHTTTIVVTVIVAAILIIILYSRLTDGTL